MSKAFIYHVLFSSSFTSAYFWSIPIIIIIIIIIIKFLTSQLQVKNIHQSWDV
jgi:type II secretory pathway component PulF